MNSRILLLILSAFLTVVCASNPPDKTKSVREALEAQYAKQRQAYFDNNPYLVRAVRAPDFSAQPPDAPRWTIDDAEAYLRASFEQVKRTIRLSFEIQDLTVEGDTAIVAIQVLDAPSVDASPGRA